MVASGGQWPDWPQGHPHAPCPSPAVSTPLLCALPRALPACHWAPQRPGPSLHDQRSLRGNRRWPCRRAPLPVLACGAGLDFRPQAGASRPRDHGQEPVSTDLLRSPPPSLQPLAARPLGPSVFNSQEPETEMRLALPGWGWVGPECRQTLPPTSREPEVGHSDDKSSGGADWARGWASPLGQP